MVPIPGVMTIAAVSGVAIATPVPAVGKGVFGAKQLQGCAVEAQHHAVRGGQGGNSRVLGGWMGAITECFPRHEACQDLMRTIRQGAPYLATATQNEPGSLGKLAA